MADTSRLASALEYLSGLDAAVAPKLRAVSDAIDPVNVARRVGLNLPMAQQAAEAAHFVGPGADIEGMVNDAREGNAAFGRGDMLGALGGYGSAAMAIPMMALPGTVAGVKKGANALADAVGGFRVYHTSPHNFDKFDLDKIGTGQGAASYGHGFYAAESPAVSGPLGAYDLEFSKAKIRKLLGRDASADPTEEEAHLADLFYKIRSGKSDHDIALDFGPPDGRGYARGMSDAATVRDNIAKIYELKLHAAPEDFLDYDANLINQSPKVQTVLERLGVRDIARSQDRYKADNDALYHELTSTEPTGYTPDNTLGFLAERTGADVYHSNVFSGSGTSGYVDEAQVSKRLKDAGIPGMRYLDGQSRSAGDGTRNYVIFDPEIIEIAKKYGLAGALMGGVAGSTNKEPE